MQSEFNGIFSGLTILITGHTGFKGSWLALWLQKMGAKIVGFSLDPPTTPSHFALAGMEQKMTHIIGDIRDFNLLKETLLKHEPQVLFHLAAQPIVLHSFSQPKETFDINAGGTVNVLEACRYCPSLKALIMVTTDKCYENQEWHWGYREKDPLGGKDPYSASKSMAELAIASYRQSFFNSSGQPLVASARAGNVVGGGDFSEFRLLPDCLKALLKKEPIQVRNPSSVRPWLSVLDALSGYLWLASSLLQKGSAFAEAWNFGPLEYQAITSQTLVEKTIELWGDGEWYNPSLQPAYQEMGLLRLNWDKAVNQLKWKPVYNWEEAVRQTVDWFKAFESSLHRPKTIDFYEIGLAHIQDYVEKARRENLIWTASEELVHN